MSWGVLRKGVSPDDPARGLTSVERTAPCTGNTNSEAVHELLPAAHRVASLTKRWLLGIHQGSVDDAHLSGYPNEFEMEEHGGDDRRIGEKREDGHVATARGAEQRQDLVDACEEMMVDEDVAYVSPTSVYRILREEDLLYR